MHILVVDDEPAIGWTFREGFQDEGFSVDTAGSAEQALQLKSNRRPDVILMDVRLPGMNGLDALATLKQSDADIPVIMMTAFGSLSTAVEAIDRGAFDYLTKPVDLDRAIATVKQALAVSKATTSSSIPVSSELIIGRSAGMQEVFRRIALVAELDLPVLITGESGTGKDLVARAIHRHSRRKGAFVPICIPALSESVVESELFGHIKGAYTDAVTDRVGAFEYANGGTLFLDEVGDMPMSTQIKLLRVLEEHKITRVGDNRPIKVNVRLLSATNRSLEQLVKEGLFRNDLYYRLKVVTVHLPPLRERRDDIVPLMDHFKKMFIKRHSKSNCNFSPAVTRRFFGYEWPGNIRQLRNFVETMVVLDTDGILDLDDLPPELLEGEVGTEVTSSPLDSGAISSASIGSSLLGKTMHDIEKWAILETLQMTGGNREEAARILQIGARTLYRKLDKYREEEGHAPRERAGDDIDEHEDE